MNHDKARQRIDPVGREYEMSVDPFVIDFSIRIRFADNRSLKRSFCCRARRSGMPLPDAIDFAIHLLRTPIATLRFEPRYPSVGGPIDVLVVTPDGMEWVQRKELTGEDQAIIPSGL